MAPSSLSSTKWIPAFAACLLAQAADAQRAADDQVGVVDPSPRVDPRGVRDRNPVVPSRDSHRFEIQGEPTDWTQVARLPLFDPELGILRRVEISLSADLMGSAGVESMADRAQEASLRFAGTVTLQRPDRSVLAELTPQRDFQADLLAFDGVVDFAGASGVNHTGILIQEVGVPIVAEASDERLFTRLPGRDTIELPVSAVGTSSAEGGGNLVVMFQQAASAVVEVTYVYDLDCNKNGVADVEDTINGTSADGNEDGIPDECAMSITRFCFGDGASNGGPKCPCSNEAEDNTDGCLNSTGVGGRLDGEGFASVSADTLRLVGSGIPPGVVALYMQGKGMTNSGHGTAFGDGLLCISGPMNRLGVQNTPDAGSAMVHPASGEPPISARQEVRPGESWHYQVWYRDDLGPCGSAMNATNGVRVVWVE